MSNDTGKPVVSNNERKVWHPVMYQQQNNCMEEQKYGAADMPHKRLINNIKRFMKESENNPEMRKKYVEDMLMALPTASKVVF